MHSVNRGKLLRGHQQNLFRTAVFLSFLVYMCRALYNVNLARNFHTVPNRKDTYIASYFDAVFCLLAKSNLSKRLSFILPHSAK